MSCRRSCRQLFIALALAFILSSCTTRFGYIEQFATEHAFQSEMVQGDPFSHRVYRRPGSGKTSTVLNIYLEGDGTPYYSRFEIAADPTPVNPVMLKLMALDSGPAVYVGRPCYFDTVRSPPCDPYHWTMGRFSSEVVSSIASVIRSELAYSEAQQLRIFGHSGGGALAVLVTRALGDLEIIEVVTLAGNIDHSDWTALHNYAPLRGSLNPVDAGPLPMSIRQLHVFGEADQNVPPALMKRAAEEILGGQWLVMPGIRHACCWEAIWPAILAGQTPD